MQVSARGHGDRAGLVEMRARRVIGAEEFGLDCKVALRAQQRGVCRILHVHGVTRYFLNENRSVEAFCLVFSSSLKYSSLPQLIHPHRIEG
jgi:hypothetical protein